MELLRAGAQQDVPVVDDGRVVQVLLGRDLPAALTRHGQGGPVARHDATGCSRMSFLDLLERHCSAQQARRQLGVFADWDRQAEAFAYDETASGFHLGPDMGT